MFAPLAPSYGRKRIEGPSAPELQVLDLMAEGLSYEEIAERIHRSPATVKSHAQSIYRKLGVRNAPQAVAVGFRQGVIQ